MVTGLLSLLLLIAGVGVALPALYLAFLAWAALRYRPAAGGPTGCRIAVLVPAHNEVELLPRCLRSLNSQSYPKDCHRVIVIADNCSDATAEVASAEGAEVWIRMDAGLGKGRALRWAMDRLLAEPDPPDTVVVVDADSVADEHLLSRLEAKLGAGHQVAQAEYLVLADSGSTRPGLMEIAFLLFHRVRFAGRSALGMPVNLVGNGMAFRRSLLEQLPWSAFSAVEDLEYSILLRLAGVGPAFAGSARVYGPMARGRRASARQRYRWEGGRFFAIRAWIWPIVAQAVRNRDWHLLDLAIDLATPPLALLFALIMAGMTATALLVALHAALLFVLAPWIVAALAVPAFILIGLLAARAPASAYRTLLQSGPAFLVRKLIVYGHLVRHNDPNRWERTERTPISLQPPTSVEIAGVPIDAIDSDTALRRVLESIGRRPLQQVCTVNLDFLMNAQRSADVARIFRHSSLNLPDGMPVVWIGRLMGIHMPERVAGADLIPRLAQASVERGARLFLLGGEGGVAERAAAQLQRAVPGLQIAGTCEPPHATIEQMDNDAIVAQINSTGADILLVALGHPKQELWIDRHRERLNVSVAIGVGCGLDLLAGKETRAPRWMHPVGLEWLYRLASDPRRLAPRYLADAAWLLSMLPTFVAKRHAVTETS